MINIAAEQSTLPETADWMNTNGWSNCRAAFGKEEERHLRALICLPSKRSVKAAKPESKRRIESLLLNVMDCLPLYISDAKAYLNHQHGRLKSSLIAG